MELSSTDIDLLEILFAREVEAALSGDSLWPLVQSRAKGYLELAERGLVERVAETLPVGRLGIMSVEGWVLTAKGHMAYCQSCGEGDPKEE